MFDLTRQLYFSWNESCVLVPTNYMNDSVNVITERSLLLSMKFCGTSITFSYYGIFFVIPVAIQALKKKKRYEKQLQQIDGTLTTIEMQREALEGANTNTAVLNTMSEAAKALKQAHQHMYVEFYMLDYHTSSFYYFC